MKTIQITVTGRVQGVGFRYVTKSIADRLNLTGTVHNNDDGSVTAVATGDEDTLQAFIQQVINNPSPTSKVSNYQIVDLPLTSFNKFQII